ncbi:LacI family DNA-binding transcriptional regulator [Roseinatronobacter alkalisoli]|uniref:Substrate-binding domain-containing protein n=1 Tax=Roseinatronobacter alkalisoli TaxID=3028235 RepID=A0ABT5TF47_9RHOB|nr:substrate-binding domain-containing protein [Roseinatronobacter sp. HJB301]MDD7972991.1 substrate-binding domain-containing protein [Roseinatronobacter sp. HJB301]
MATLRDLSKHLGISVTQVSRALNGHDDVSAATKQRVAEAARELGYSANRSARMLKSGRSGIVAMVIDTAAERDVPDVLMAGVIGLSTVFARRDTQLIVHAMPEGADPVDTYAKLARSGLIEGFIVVNPQSAADPRIAFLTDEGVPFAVHGRDRTAPDYPFVDIDNHAVGNMLTTHLMTLGHRRIALVDGPAEAAFSAARLRGYRAALETGGLPFDPQLVHQVPMTELVGSQIMAALLDTSVRPTAVIAGNTMLAAGIYATISAHGLHVGTDISVIAHDDGLPRHPSADFVPALTVTESAIADAFEPLADVLLARISDRRAPTQSRMLAVRLVQRNSVQPPSQR